MDFKRDSIQIYQFWSKFEQISKNKPLTRPESTFTLRARLNYVSITDIGSFC